MRENIRQRRKAGLQRFSLAHLIFREATGEFINDEERQLLFEVMREKEKAGHKISLQVRERLDRLIAQMRQEGHADLWELSLLGEGALDEEQERKALAIREQAEATFQEHLPQLLVERPGQWVAYHGPKLVGYAKTDLELYRECQRQQIPAGEYLVLPIELEGPDTIFFYG